MTHHTSYGTLSNPIPIGIGRVADIASLPTPVLRATLFVQRGDSFELVFRAYREVCLFHGGCAPRGCACDFDYPYGTGSGIQILTGFQGAAAIRKAIDFPQVSVLTVDVDQTGAGSPTRGIIRVTADPTATRVFPEFGVWDLEINDGTDQLRKTLMEGPMVLNRDVLI